MAKGKYQRWLEPEGLLLLEGWARDGLTDEQIAHNMGINVGTLYRWKVDHCEICEALKKGKEVVDILVENAILKRALGYTAEEVVTEADDSGKKHIKKTQRHIPGDVTAQIFWLKNRRPDKWRDKPVYEERVEYEDDGLLDALNASASDDWSDGDDSGNI